MNTTTDSHITGCIIDASHFSALYLDVKVVDYAVSKGFPLFDEEWETHGHAVDAIAGAMEGILAFAIRDQVRYIADEAVDWLNDRVAEGYAYHVEDNSLYLGEIEQDEQF